MLEEPQRLGEAIDDYNSHVTHGNYKTEDDAKAAFVQAFTGPDWTIYNEVPCWYFGGSVFGDKPTGRIDFLLAPRKTLIDRGWKMGVVGVEVKKSGHKVGPLICQMLDYAKAVFELPVGGLLVSPRVVACFPGFDNKGTIASVMAQHRVGCVRVTPYGRSILVDSTNIYKVSGEQTEIKSIACGYKNGSR